MQKYCFNCMRPLEASPVCRFCGHSSANRLPAARYHLHPGTILAQRYLIGSVLGEGGFGITYIGLDLTLNKRVAVKEFYPSSAANRTEGSGVTVTPGKEEMFRSGVERFLVEAKSVAALSDEDGIVDVLDYFESNNTAYIVMEYLEGETLKAYVNSRGVFDADRLIALMMPMMRSLKAMHARGVIHRDISPDNIMLTRNGKLKLMDFGSARYYTNEERPMSIVLKQGFAPEEQYRSNGRQGPHTDVYALCATIYACITGRVPQNSLDRIAHDNLQPPSRLGVRITRPHEAALMRGLAVYAQNRIPDMEMLIREFNRREPAVQLPPQAPPPPPPKKSKAPVVAAIVISLVAAAAVVGLILLLVNANKATEKKTEPETTEAAAETIVPSTEYHPVETTAEPTTEEPTQPPTEEPTQPPTLGYLTKAQIDSLVYDIEAASTRNMLYADNQQKKNGYAYTETADGYIWISDPDTAMNDDSTSKKWYFFNDKGELYYIFEKTFWTEYRYYIYQDELIRYSVGAPDKSQVTYDYGDFRISGAEKDNIAQAYKAYHAIFTTNSAESSSEPEESRSWFFW